MKSNIDIGFDMNDKISASIEVSPKQAIEYDELQNLFPAGTRVYITDINGVDNDTMVAASARIRQLGYHPVPHFACRRLTSKTALMDRIKRLTGEAGVRDVLVIGGGLFRPRGEFSSTMKVLETASFDQFGITDIGIAGHPDGSPEFSAEVALEALRLKRNFALRTDARMRIVTQFGFDAEKFINWTDQLRDSGIDLPVHLGVAGPATITTLLKFATMCGVGNSLSFLKKRGSALATLATGFSPEIVVEPIEQHVRNSN